MNTNRSQAAGGRVLLAVAELALWQGGATARAGEIIAVFSNPVLAGNILNDPSVGDLTSVDNTGTAVDSITNAGSSLSWGVSTAGVPATEDYSELTFTGSSYSSIPTGQFQIGTISFLNGTSDLDSLIFGATLSFYLNSVSTANFLGSDNVIISTTSNQFSGTGLSPSQLAEDADYINICGNNSNICGSSLEAYEDTEGGTGVTADLFGTISGDPQLTLNSITVSANQAGTGGIVGNEPALGEVPEPSSLTLMSAGLLVCAGLSGRKLVRRKAVR